MEWREIPGFPDYQVSSTGLVRRVRATVRQAQRNLPFVLTQRLQLGYPTVLLLNASGKQIKISIHRLVAFAFLPLPTADQSQVAHFDGNRENNNLANLRWATRRENMADMHRHGRRYSKLTRDQVYQIFTRHDLNYRTLAELFDVSRATVECIRNGRTWRHVTDLYAGRTVKLSHYGTVS